jgi:hypothetical protein
MRPFAFVLAQEPTMRPSASARLVADQICSALVPPTLHNPPQSLRPAVHYETTHAPIHLRFPLDGYGLYLGGYGRAPAAWIDGHAGGNRLRLSRHRAGRHATAECAKPCRSQTDAPERGRANTRAIICRGTAQKSRDPLSYARAVPLCRAARANSVLLNHSSVYCYAIISIGM